MDGACVQTPIIKVPQGMILPQIETENLRASALMDPNRRQPFSQRHLHHVGKYAYNLAVSIYLTTTFPGASDERMSELQQRLATVSEVSNIAVQFGLDKSVSSYNSSVDEDAMANVFFAWTAALLAEGGIYMVCKFISTLLEANYGQIQGLACVPNGEPSSRHSLSTLDGQNDDAMEDQENDAPVEIPIPSGSVTVGESPSKRKLTYSDSQDSLTSEPEDPAQVAGSETMKRRRFATARSFLLPRF
ncbi:hypothetical protein TWF730_004556 [Orbilia blumenaviensis]|uniref:RNase III domain-containing protein n=1 Tax=Orbilia blumenaviensis TaxID=1796055 RepID=A0AAV9U187_9PEZI